MKRKRFTFILFCGAALLCASALRSRAAAYYVASGVPTSLDAAVPAAGVDSSGRGSLTLPFKTIQYAAAKAIAGDTVIVRNGTYTENVVIGYNTYYQYWVTTATGTGENARIVFKAENTYHAFIRSVTANTNSYAYYNGCFNISSADPHVYLNYAPTINFTYLATKVSRIIGYIDIQGFDLQSNGYNGSGIECNWAHHIRCLNNRAHDSGSGGILMSQCDYSIIDGNTVYNNCRTSTYNGSGISTLRNAPFDQAGGYHNQITRNTVYGNYISNNAATVPGGTTLIYHTDGNGIIVDTCAYDLGTLIQNNVSYGNGGPGIILDGTPNAGICNNTCYDNNIDTSQDVPAYSTYRGEIYLHQTTWAQDYDANGSPVVDGNGKAVSTSGNPLNQPCKNVKIWSNICVPKDNYTASYSHNFYGLNIENTSAGCDIENNWTYRASGGSQFYYEFRNVTASFPDDPDFTGAVIGSNYGVPLNGFPQRGKTLTGTPWSGNLTANPLFVSAGMGAAANFILQSGSLCREKAWNQAGNDHDGSTRPYGAGYDLGAYEYRPCFGSLALEGIGDLAAVNSGSPVGNVTFDFRAPGAAAALFTKTAPLAAASGSPNGAYTLDDVLYGTYDVAVKGGKNLRVVLLNVTVGAGTTLANVLLPGGDANNDNTVNTSDFNVLAGAFGSVYDPAQPNSVTGYDPAADFNFDGKVDTSDFNLLVGNFGNSGDL